MKAILSEHFVEFQSPGALADNFIFYDHKNDLTFNWKNYGDKVSSYDFELFKKYFAYAEENNITLTFKN